MGVREGVDEGLWGGILEDSDLADLLEATDGGGIEGLGNDDLTGPAVIHDLVLPLDKRAKCVTVGCAARWRRDGLIHIILARCAVATAEARKKST